MVTVDNVRSLFVYFYDDLARAAKAGQPQWSPKPPDSRIYPDQARYHGVFLLPGGDALGTHSRLLKYLRACQLTGRRKIGGPLVIEAHHLLEDRCMAHFGVAHAEGFCVALDEIEHAAYSAELPRHLRRSTMSEPFMADIDVVYDAHCVMYREAGRAKWIPLMRVWLQSLRPRIVAHYSAGRVAGATAADIDRVKQFFAKL